MLQLNRLFAGVVSFLSITALLCCGGCSQNPRGRTAVSGQVTFDGKPLDKGTIEFRPQARENSVGSGGVIADGAYTIPTLQGLPPGKYEVRIYSGRPDDSPLPEGVPPGAARPWIERIPPMYNVQTTLNVEVTSTGPNKFDFKLSKAP